MSTLIGPLLKNINALCVEDEVRKEQAPRNVIDAAKEIDLDLKLGLTPKVGLVQYVQRWLMRKSENNRYGK